MHLSKEAKNVVNLLLCWILAHSRSRLITVLTFFLCFFLMFNSNPAMIVTHCFGAKRLPSSMTTPTEARTDVIRGEQHTYTSFVVVNFNDHLTLIIDLCTTPFNIFTFMQNVSSTPSETNGQSSSSAAYFWANVSFSLSTLLIQEALL